MSKKNKCWSADNEAFNCETLGDLLDENSELEVGNTVYVADAVPPSIKHLCDADDVLDVIRDRAYEIGGEYADDCAQVSKEATEQLNKYLARWIRANCNLNFWSVKNPKPYILTDDDFATAPATGAKP